MSIDILTLAMARKYVKETVNGLGAVKGAPCEIIGIEDTGDANVVTFQWTGADGSVQTQEMTIPYGMTDAEQEALEQRLLEVEEMARRAEETAKRAEELAGDGCDCEGGSIEAEHDGQGNVTVRLTGLKLTDDGQGNIGLG